MIENGFDLVLDGNAAAGLLQEIFVLKITKSTVLPPQSKASEPPATMG